MTEALVTALWGQPCFTHLDRQFADFIYNLDGGDNFSLKLAALLVSSRTGNGDICIELDRIGGMDAAELLDEYEVYGDTGITASMNLPEADVWEKELKRSEVVAAPGGYAPIVLDGERRLYLYRYHEYQGQVYEEIVSRAKAENTEFDTALLREGIERLFPSSGDDETDWQRVAACAAVMSKAAVISGGPGTGKTSTVGKILVLLIEQGLKSGKLPAIAIAAPTGKAAARMKEALGRSLKEMNAAPEIMNAMPEDAATIHRLLGTIPGSPYFRHNAERPLPWDIVVVDESSMADIALLAKFLTALHRDAAVVLLGDKDQLASVEAGAVLGDLCDTGTVHGYSETFVKRVEESAGTAIPPDRQRQGEPAMADSLVVLEKSYRFSGKSGIGELGKAVRNGNSNGALALLRDSAYTDIILNEYGNELRLEEKIHKTVAERYNGMLS